MALLTRWWVRKYQLPPTSESFLAYTEEELWIEFYEDFYADPKNASYIEFEEGEDDIQFVTGDPEVDELERRLAEGSISDEEIQRVLASWVGEEPPQADGGKADEAVEDFGDGFVDEAPGLKEVDGV